MIYNSASSSIALSPLQSEARLSLIQADFNRKEMKQRDDHYHKTVAPTFSAGGSNWNAVGRKLNHTVLLPYSSRSSPKKRKRRKIQKVQPVTTGAVNRKYARGRIGRKKVRRKVRHGGLYVSLSTSAGAFRIEFTPVKVISDRMMGVVRFAIKATLVGGVVYYSVQQGLWSKSEDSVQLYGRIYNNVAPYVKDSIPEEVINELPPLPSTSDISNSIKSSWNKGVIASMKFLSETPTHVTNGVQSISQIMRGYIEQQSVSEKSQ